MCAGHAIQYAARTQATFENIHGYCRINNLFEERKDETIYGELRTDRMSVSLLCAAEFHILCAGQNHSAENEYQVRTSDDPGLLLQ